MPVYIAGPLFAYGHESITVDSTAGGKSFTAATYLTHQTHYSGSQARQPKQAVVTVEDQPLRWCCDPAATVSSTVGHLASAGDVIHVEGYENIKNFRAIRSTGSSSNIRVTYYRDN